MEFKTIAKPILNRIKSFAETLADNHATQPTKSEKFKRYASHISKDKPYEELIWALDFPNEHGVSEFLLGFWLNKPDANQLKIFDEIYGVFEANKFQDYKFEKHPNGVWVRIPVNLSSDEQDRNEKLEEVYKYTQIVLPPIIRRCHEKIAGIKSKINANLDYVQNWNLDTQQVLVVAGGWASKIAKKYGIYECQNHRSFRTSKYLAFYDDGKIEDLFEIVDKPYDNANAANTPEIARMALEIQNYNGNISRRCFKLKHLQKIGPVMNDSVSKSGKKVPFTYGQARYTNVELIKKAKLTSELIHGLNVNYVTDSFVNDRKTISPKVDILWVIDNSGSMSPYQKELGMKFHSFINGLLNKPVIEIPDFRMAVTTTDEKDNGKFFMGSLNYSLNKENAIDQDLKDDFLSKFNRVVQVGSSGSATEKGLKCSWLCVKNNPSFFRLDAPLIVNIVTDEEDDDSTSVDQYLSDINSSRSGQRFIINLIGLSGFKRYEHAVNKTKGISLNIKSDFTRILENISLQLVEVIESFALSQRPINPNSIKCSVDDKPTTDFEYNSSSNTIKAGKSIPDGAAFEIEYEIEDN